MTDYRYATGDLMGRPQTYFYTEFEGPSFLTAWMRSRQRVLATLPPPLLEVLPVVAGAAGTQGLLEAALREAQSVSSGHRGPLPFHAETVLRKFEVSKRIYDQYDAELRPADKTRFRTHVYYVRAGEVFLAAFEAGGDLRALNALLKCIDTLAAHATELNPGEGARVAKLIQSEREMVLRLCAEKEVTVP